AMGAIALGLCNVAVIAYGSTQRSVGRKQASVREINPYETPFKPFLPASAYALVASRHIHEFGTTREQLAAVAVAARSRCGTAAWSRGEGARSSSGRRNAPNPPGRRPPMCWAAATRLPTPAFPACRTSR